MGDTTDGRLVDFVAFQQMGMDVWRAHPAPIDPADLALITGREEIAPGVEFIWQDPLRGTYHRGTVADDGRSFVSGGFVGSLNYVAAVDYRGVEIISAHWVRGCLGDAMALARVDFT